LVIRYSNPDDTDDANHISLNLLQGNNKLSLSKSAQKDNKNYESDANKNAIVRNDNDNENTDLETSATHDSTKLNTEGKFKTFWNTTLISTVVAIYILSCLILAFVIVYAGNIHETALIVFVVLLTLILLSTAFVFIRIHYTIPWQFWQDSSKHYLTPFCPYVPLLCIFINCYMIASLSIDGFARVLLWVFVGLLIYIFYGYHHSTLNITRQSLLTSVSPNSKPHNDDY